MNIVGSSVLPFQSPNELRPDVVERQQRTSKSGDSQLDEPSAQSIEPRQVGSESLPRPVPRTNETNQVFNNNKELESVDRSLSLSTRKALQAFAENSPSPEQQLGIELAGIDIRV